jgi:hypothetical protein
VLQLGGYVHKLPKKLETSNLLPETKCTTNVNIIFAIKTAKSFTRHTQKQSRRQTDDLCTSAAFNDSLGDAVFFAFLLAHLIFF